MDKAKKQLLNGTMVYFIGNALVQVVSLFLLRFVTGKITADEYGYYNLIMTIDNLITPILTLQITDAVFRFFMIAKDENEKKDYYTNAVIVIIIGIVLVALCIGIIDICFFKIEHALLVALYIISSNIFNLYTKITRAMNENVVYVGVNFFKTITYILVEIVCLFAFKLGVESLFIAVIVSTFLSIFIIELKISPRRYFSLLDLNKKSMHRMLRFSIPLIPNTALWWMTSSINSIIVTIHLGLDVNGIYTVANKFSSVLNIVTSVFSMAWQESAIKEYGTKDFKKFHTETFNMYIVAVLSAISILLPIMAVSIPYLIDSSYYDAIAYAPFLLIATGLATLSSFASQTIVAQGKTERLMYTTILGVIINLAIVFFTVDYIGLWSAVFGTIGSNLMLVISRLIMIKNEFSGHLKFCTIIVLFLCNLVGIFCYFQNSILLNICAIIIFIIFAFVFNRKLIVDVFLVVMEKLRRKS